MLNRIALAAFCLCVHATMIAAQEKAILSPVPTDAGKSWSFSDGPEFPGAKGALDINADGAVKVTYDFTGGGNYVAFYHDLPEPLAITAISFEANLSTSPSLTLRVTDSTGQTLQKGTTFTEDGWCKARADMRGWAAWWGGANDGVIHQPIRQIGMVVENRFLLAQTGEALIRNIVIEEGSVASSTMPLTGMAETSYLVTDFQSSPSFQPVGAGRLEQENGPIWKLDFSQSPEAGLLNSISLQGAPKALKLHILDASPGVLLHMAIATHFQTFQRDIATLTGGEQYIKINTPPDGWSFHGGENDGKLYPPLRITAIRAFKNTAPTDAFVRLGALECTTEISRPKGVPLTARASFEPAGGASCAVSAINLTGRDLPGMLTLTARDWDGAVLHEKVIPWALPQGIYQSRTESIPAATRSYTRCDLSYALDEQEIGAASTCAVSMPDNAAYSQAVPDSPWGMGVYLYRYGNTPESLREMNHAAELASKAGVKWSREQIDWSRVEPERGKFDFSFFDAMMDAADARGISIYGLLCYWNSWTKPYTEEGIEDFTRYVRATVTHFKDRIKYWEIYNEPNIFFWEGPKELYPKLLAKCYAVIKEVDPEAKVLGCSSAGIDFEWIAKCMKEGGLFDILTIHPYRGHLAEDQFMDELRRVRALVNDRPVWITEMGWPTQTGGADEQEQATLLARTYLASALSGAVSNVSWYDFKNDGNDPDYNEFNFGVLHQDYTPKPAYRALATLTSVMGDGPFRAAPTTGKYLYALASDKAVAIWSSRPGLDIAMKIASGTPCVTSLMGDTKIVTPTNDEIRMRLNDGAPIFITGAELASITTVSGGQDEDILQF